jgi:hypothetical protein
MSKPAAQVSNNKNDLQLLQTSACIRTAVREATRYTSCNALEPAASLKAVLTREERRVASFEIGRVRLVEKHRSTSASSNEFVLHK